MKEEIQKIEMMYQWKIMKATSQEEIERLRDEMNNLINAMKRAEKDQNDQ